MARRGKRKSKQSTNNTVTENREVTVAENKELGLEDILDFDMSPRSAGPADDIAAEVNELLFSLNSSTPPRDSHLDIDDLFCTTNASEGSWEAPLQPTLAEQVEDILTSLEAGQYMSNEVSELFSELDASKELHDDDLEYNNEPEEKPEAKPKVEEKTEAVKTVPGKVIETQNNSSSNRTSTVVPERRAMVMRERKAKAAAAPAKWYTRLAQALTCGCQMDSAVA